MRLYKSSKIRGLMFLVDGSIITPLEATYAYRKYAELQPKVWCDTCQSYDCRSLVVRVSPEPEEL